MTEPEPEPRRCSYCGHVDDGRNTVSTHSGREECHGCWNHRKLDRPAAAHWAKVAREFLSNVDAYDVLTYLPKALEGGDRVTDYAAMLRSVQAVAEHSERVLRDGPYHQWTDAEAPTSGNPRV